MKTMHARRLLKLAAFLQTMPRAKFDFSIIMNEAGKPPLEALAAGETRCGTVGCAVGWAPAVWPRLLKFDGNGIDFKPAPGAPTAYGTWSVVQQFFGLTYEEALYVFQPGGISVYYTTKYTNTLPETATPKRVARHIRNFVKREYDGKAVL